MSQRVKPRIRLVRQKNLSSGCGPACVAMMAGVSYEQAIKAMWDGRLYKRDLYTWPIDLKRALRRLGVSPAPRMIKCKSFGATSLPAIFGTGKGTPNEHWVVYDPETGRLYDPLTSNYIKRDLEELDATYKPYYRLESVPPDR